MSEAILRYVVIVGGGVAESFPTLEEAVAGAAKEVDIERRAAHAAGQWQSVPTPAICVAEIRHSWRVPFDEAVGASPFSGDMVDVLDKPLSLQERLARAVLDGDPTTALILADEVIAQRQAELEGKEFVSREEMREVLLSVRWRGTIVSAAGGTFAACCPNCRGRAPWRGGGEGHKAGCGLAKACGVED